MKQRLIVAGIGIPVLLLILLACPAWATAAMCALLSAVGCYELMHAVGGEEWKRLAPLTVASGALAFCAGHGIIDGMALMAWVFLTVVYVFATAIVTHGKPGAVSFKTDMAGLFGALGHSINDADTGVLLPLGEGFITTATVSDVLKGEKGRAGELHGAFDTGSRLGCVQQNTPSGIFGTTDCGFAGTAVPVAADEEIENGPATILANVAGSEVREYSVEISRAQSGGRLMVTVTDPALLAATGGIVQGMSGSPILQNGKLCGAVTHVLISDPTRGYGITISSMLSAAESAQTLAVAA